MRARRRQGSIALAAIAVAIAAPVGAQIDPHVHRERLDLSLEQRSIVWVPEGVYSVGASTADLRFAVELCQAEHDLSVAIGCELSRFEHERGPRSVRIERFGVDRLEITQRQWRGCVIAGRCPPPRIDEADRRFGGDDLPVAGIRRDEAQRFCELRGGRLPTEEEWEVAARGTDVRRRFPWGRFYHSSLANHGRPPLRPDDSDGFLGPSPVGSFPDGASPFGALDLAGNVAEWTSSGPSQRDFELLRHVGADPLEYAIIRGGSWAHGAVDLRVTHRGLIRNNDSAADLGARCVYPPD